MNVCRYIARILYCCTLLKYRPTSCHLRRVNRLLILLLCYILDTICSFMAEYNGRSMEKMCCAVQNGFVVSLMMMIIIIIFFFYY